jgi:hypothetical protein
MNGFEVDFGGSPEHVRGVSYWLRDSLARGVSDAATAIYNARNRADAGWHGAAGEAFRARMTIGAENLTTSQRL